MSYIPPQGRKSPTPESFSNENNKHSSSQYYSANNNNANFNYSGQTFVRPPTGSKAIPIINPNNKEVVQPRAKEKEIAENSRPVTIVDPKEKESEKKTQNEETETPTNDAESPVTVPTPAKEETVENSTYDAEEKTQELAKKQESANKNQEIGQDLSKEIENATEATKENDEKAQTSAKEESLKSTTAEKKETNVSQDPVCKGDRVVYEIAFMMKFKEFTTVPEGANLTPFADISTERFSDRGGRSMSRRETSGRGRGPRLAGEGMLRGNSSRGPRRQDSAGPGSPGGMERQGSSRNRSSRGGKSRRQPKEDTPLIAPEDVVPLAKSENRWVPRVQSEPEPAKTEETEEPEEKLIPKDMIIRKVKSLLNKLTLEKFDSISMQIWEYAKQAEKERCAESLQTVIDLIFDKACDEPGFAVMWAQLAKKLFDLTATNEKIKNEDIVDEKTNQAVWGGALFRKYLLMRCQDDFYKGWKSDIPKIDESAPDVMLTDEYYAAVKAKRRGLGLVQFIGELYKFQMLSNNVMKECLRRLCSNIETPEDEETETMCKLITTVGRVFEVSESGNKQWLDVYFSRMKEMYDSKTLSSRVKFMIMDVMDLRKSRWTLKRAGGQTGPSTIAQIHQEAKKANEEKEKETMKRSGSSRSFIR
ncbi:armadillo-type protein [Sporodiniella umbellata]|nr:armadillo-type protein [Sporodiniella umbellata]